MNTEILNRWGEHFVNFAWPMLWQSSALIAVVLALDVALRRKVRAAIRHALWLVVLLKLMLPPALALPTSPSWWMHRTAPPPAKSPPVSVTVTYGEAAVPNLSLPPAPVMPQRAAAMSLAEWLTVLSGGVSAGLLVWLLIRWRVVARKIRDASPREELDGLLNESARLAGWRPAVRLKLAGTVMSPAVCGLIRPVILLPQSLVKRLSPEQLRAVLVHELIHLRRGDVWVNCAQALLQIVYWWHPLLWLANARIRRAREEAVDDAVMLALHEDAEIYAPTLLEVAKIAFNRPLASLGLVGILESRSALRQRIERLVNFDAPKKAGLTIVSILGILAFSAVALPMGQGPEPTNAPALAPNGNLSEAGNAVGANTESGKVDGSPPKVEVFIIKHFIDESDLMKRLKGRGVNIPPTVVLYEDNHGYVLLLARGSDDVMRLIYHVVLELNGYSTMAGGTNLLRNAAISASTNTMAAKPIANSDATNLEMRVFRVDKVTFATSLQKFQHLRTNDILMMAEELFGKFGVDLTAPGRSIAYNDLGLLFVRARPSELDNVERIVQALNETDPMIHIKARFIKVPVGGWAAIGKAGTTVNPGKTNQAEIISADKMKALNHELGSMTGAETLAEPESLVVNGRQTQMRATEIQEFVTNVTAAAAQTEKIEIGPVLDLVPNVLSDGYTVDLRAMPRVAEFLGNERPTNSGSATSLYHRGVRSPIFQIETADTTVNLWDGQTLVLGPLDPAFEGETKGVLVGWSDQKVTVTNWRPKAAKEAGSGGSGTFVFLTVMIVDAVGNRVHSDAEMRQVQERAKSGIPKSVIPPTF